MNTPLQRTTLYDDHIRLNARMVEFGGWEMPVQYTGIIDEHRAVRERAGIFDVSHMGEFWVTGPDALAFLQYVTTADVSQLAVGHAGYALFCRPDGGVVDDHGGRGRTANTSSRTEHRLHSYTRPPPWAGQRSRSVRFYSQQAKGLAAILQNWRRRWRRRRQLPPASC